MYATVWVLCRICRPREEPLSAGRVEFTPAATAKQKGIYTYLVRIQNFLFHFPFDEIFLRLFFFTLGHDNIRESDRHDRRYLYIPSFALPIYKTTCDAKPYLCCCCCCCCYTTYSWLAPLGVFFFFQLSRESYMVMDVVVENPQKSSGYDQGTTMIKKTCESWLQDVLLLLSFLLWCPDDRRKNTRTGTPWCIADWLLQVLRSRHIATNY